MAATCYVVNSWFWGGNLIDGYYPLYWGGSPLVGSPVKCALMNSSFSYNPVYYYLYGSYNDVGISGKEITANGGYLAGGIETLVASYGVNEGDGYASFESPIFTPVGADMDTTAAAVFYVDDGVDRPVLCVMQFDVLHTPKVGLNFEITYGIVFESTRALFTWTFPT